MEYYNIEAIIDQPEIYRRVKPIYTLVDVAFIEALIYEYENEPDTAWSILMRFYSYFTRHKGSKLDWLKHTAEKYYLAAKTQDLYNLSEKWLQIFDALESYIKVAETNKRFTGPEIIKEECNYITVQLEEYDRKMKDLWLELSVKYKPTTQEAINQAWKRSKCRKAFDKANQVKFERK